MKKPDQISGGNVLASEAGRRWPVRPENRPAADRLRTPSVSCAGTNFCTPNRDGIDPAFRLGQPSRYYSKTRTGSALWNGFGVTVFERSERVKTQIHHG